jgi:excisionase family DNA binding protein
VSPSTLKRWADEASIRSERTPGGHRRFRRADLNELELARGGGGDEPRRWADALLGSHEQLRIQTRVFDTRVRLGSWWEMAEQLVLAVREMWRRCDAGDATAIDVQSGLERLRRALGWALAHLPRAADAPAALLASVPQNQPNVRLLLLELCLAERGWRIRWAGPSRCADVADELARRKPEAIVVDGCCSADRDLLEPYARELPDVANTLGIPVAFLGPEWPDVAPRAVRLSDFAEAHAWIRQLAARGAVDRCGPGSTPQVGASGVVEG